jgi:sulfoxide reductase heme-binding subunit YedZ
MMLHRLIYISAIAGVVHYIWLVKKDIRKPMIYAVILAVLLLWRIGAWILKRQKGAAAKLPEARPVAS